MRNNGTEFAAKRFPRGRQVVPVPSSGAIQLTPLDAQPETRNLRRLKRAIRERWGQVPL